MSLARINCGLRIRSVPVIQNGRRNHTVPAAAENEYSEEPKYEPILDLSYRARKARTYASWHEEVKKVTTVEGKLLKVNMPRFYGWCSVMLHEGVIPFDGLRQAQYVTRTHIVGDAALPSYYNSVISTEKLDAITSKVKNLIEDALEFEYCSRLREQEVSEADLKSPEAMDKIISKSVVHQVNRTMLASLASEFPHLLEAEVDFDPRIEAFWFTGGINPPPGLVKRKKHNPVLKDIADDPIERAFQYRGNPILQVRHNLPLKEIISHSESENPALDVPQFKFDPKVLGYNNNYQHGTSIPGFWPGDPSQFGLISYNNRSYMLRRSLYGDDIEALKTQAVLGCYSWLLSQACYLGFSTFNDVTYPLTTQMVITNGQWWSFCVYQLNTTLLHSNNIDENPKRNVCWITDPMKLFDTVENGKVLGFNEEVLKNLIKFYTNTPEERVGVDMTPYLGQFEQLVADIEHDERRVFLEQQFKHTMANRPKHKLVPEIYNWQWIYHIRHKTRPMDKKREPWEFGINMMLRRMDDHPPEYVPKCLRPDVPKYRNRFKKTYYP